MTALPKNIFIIVMIAPDTNSRPSLQQKSANKSYFSGEESLLQSTSVTKSHLKFAKKIQIRVKWTIKFALCPSRRIRQITPQS